MTGVTVTIVDTAGGESAATNSAIRYSDLCLIPTRPSVADIEATAATLRVIRAWHKPFAYVLNQTPIRAAARLAGARTCAERRSSTRYLRDRGQTLYRDA